MSRLMPCLVLIPLLALTQATGPAAETGAQAGARIETGSGPDPVSTSVAGSVAGSRRVGRRARLLRRAATGSRPPRHARH